MVSKITSEATIFCSPSTNFETINNMKNNRIQMMATNDGVGFWRSKLVLGLRFAKFAPLTNQI